MALNALKCSNTIFLLIYMIKTDLNLIIFHAGTVINNYLRTLLRCSDPRRFAKYAARQSNHS